MNHAGGGLSAWGTWLVVPTAVALVPLVGRGASLLAVPPLWPVTQLHDASMALPAARQSRLLAFLLSFSIPLLPAAAVIAEAIRIRAMQRWVPGARRSVAGQ